MKPIIERGTGRRYVLVKVYRPAGLCTGGDGRRYDVVKRYI